MYSIYLFYTHLIHIHCVPTLPATLYLAVKFAYGYCTCWKRALRSRRSQQRSVVWSCPIVYMHARVRLMRFSLLWVPMSCLPTHEDPRRHAVAERDRSEIVRSTYVRNPWRAASLFPRKPASWNPANCIPLQVGSRRFLNTINPFRVLIDASRPEEIRFDHVLNFEWHKHGRVRCSLTSRSKGRLHLRKYMDRF